MNETNEKSPVKYSIKNSGDHWQIIETTTGNDPKAKNFGKESSGPIKYLGTLSQAAHVLHDLLLTNANAECDLDLDRLQVMLKESEAIVTQAVREAS